MSDVLNCKITVTINDSYEIENYAIKIDSTFDEYIISGSINYNLNTNL